jgi:hypothetical protein
MSASDKQPIAVVTACMRRDGTPTFAKTEVAVTDEEVENGVQFYLVEAELLEAGFEEPFVHFPENEAPVFLFPAVETSPGVETETIVLSLPEGA